MADFDIMCFIEYYDDKTAVYDPVTFKRIPQGQWQNFYQEPQTLDPATYGIDTPYSYLPFNVDGFARVNASALSDLTVEIAAVSGIIDITDSALTKDNFIYAWLFMQPAGQNAIDPGTSFPIATYVGSIVEASVTDVAVRWTVGTGLSVLDPQVPTRKVTADMLLKNRGK
jgi:hypothetical protein